VKSSRWVSECMGGARTGRQLLTRLTKLTKMMLRCGRGRSRDPAERRRQNELLWGCRQEEGGAGNLRPERINREVVLRDIRRERLEEVVERPGHGHRRGRVRLRRRHLHVHGRLRRWLLHDHRLLRLVLRRIRVDLRHGRARLRRSLRQRDCDGERGSADQTRCAPMPAGAAEWSGPKTDNARD